MYEYKVSTPPVLRIIVLVSAVALLVGLAFVASDGAAPTRAQTSPTLIDYDTDDDGLIDIKTRDQLQAIHYDLDGDGSPSPRAKINVLSAPVAWATAYPNAMPGAGCPPRDHDNDPATADQPSCIGYELVNDINFTSFHPIGRWGGQVGSHAPFTAKLVGNGFQISGFRFQPSNGHRDVGLFAQVGKTGSIEGLGANNAYLQATVGNAGVLVNELRGSVIGSYSSNSQANAGVSGGIASSVKTGSDFGGLIAHSYVTGYNSNSGRTSNGGLAGVFDGQNNGNVSRCLNTFFTGNLDSLWTFQGGNSKGLIARGIGSGTRLDNCWGDNSSDGNTDFPWQGANANQKAAHTRSATQLKAPQDYSGPFAAWDDYSADGFLLADDAPRADFWFFGDSTTFPVLKAWGHDRTHAPARSTTMTDSVDLCTRTPEVAAEIIRLLKDNTVKATGVATNAPAAVTALTGCTGTNTQTVTLANLRDYAATSATNMLNLRPTRSWPPEAKLTKLDINDFAYLPNVSHFNLGNNALEELPPRLFHGVSLRYLDLSNNELTSLPTELFAGVTAVTTVGGNALLLNGNQLTDTGIPGRILDPLTHLNGLDLSDNALTAVNTRWFQLLVNLGRKAATTPPYTHALGLHLAGNTITEHYYSHKVFSGIKDNRVTYQDVTAGGGTTSAEDALRTAIITAIDNATASHANLDLASTSFYFRSGGATTGYQANSVTACLSTQTQGPGRGDFLSDVLPACLVQPHWTWPHQSSDAATTSPTLASATASPPTTINSSITHAVTTDWVGYQVRYRPSTVDLWTPWLNIPITDTAGSKALSINAYETGNTYQLQFRALSTSGEPSSATGATVPLTPFAGPTGFTASTGTTAVGTVALSWTAIDTTAYGTGNTVQAHFYRFKPQSQSVYTGKWHQLAANATSATLSGLVPGQTYDVQIVGGVDGSDTGTTPELFTTRATDSATALAIPANLTAVPGTNPGEIDVRWNQQTASQVSQARFNVRRKRKSENWPETTPFGWMNVPDNSRGTDSGTDQHDETGITLGGLLGGAQYDIEVRFHWNNTLGWQPASVTTGTPTRAPTPTGFTVTPGYGSLALSWTQQTAITTGQARYELRYKKAAEEWPTEGNLGWANISGSSHSTSGHTIVELEGVPYDVQVRFLWSNAIGYSLPVEARQTPTTVPRPIRFMAAPGTNPGDIDLTWTRQTLITAANARYELRYKKSSTTSWPANAPFGWATIAGAGHAADSHTVTGLEANTSYDFELRLHVNGPSRAADDDATTKVVQPPDSLRVTDSAGEVDIRWTRQTASTEGSAHYQIRYKKQSDNWPGTAPFGWTTISGSSASTDSVFVNGLDANVPYNIELRFRWSTAVGYSAAARVIATTTAVPAPQNVTAATGDLVGTVVFTWDTQHTTSSARAKFQVRAKYTTGGNWTGWSDVPDSDDPLGHAYDEHGWTMSGLSFFRPHDFEVRFAVGGSASPAVSVTNIRPGYYPRNLQAVPGAVPGTIEVTWDPQTAYQGSRNRVAVQVSPAGTRNVTSGWPCCTDIGSGGWSATSATVNNIGNVGQTPQGATQAGQFYDIRANFNHTGDSTDRWTNWNNPNNEIPYVLNVMAANVLAPANLQAATSTKAVNAVDLTWDQQTASTETVSHFEYRYKLTSASNWATSGASTTASAADWTNVGDSGDNLTHTYDETGITVTGLTANTGYDFEVRFHWNATHGNTPTADIPNESATSSTVPSPPNFVAATGTTTGAVDLSWDLVTGAANYQYRHKVAGQADPTPTWNWIDVPDSSGSPTGVADEDEVTVTTDLTGGISYTFELRARTSSAQSSAATADATAQTQAPPNTITFAQGTAPGTIAIGWTAPTGGGQDGYEFRFKRDNQGAYPTSGTGAWADVPANTNPVENRAARTGYIITELIPGATYDVQLRAETGSTYSTPGQAGTGRVIAKEVAAPGTFSALLGDQPGEIDLSWVVIPVAGLPSTPSQHNVVYYEYRYKLDPVGATWSAWTPVPDQNSDNDRSDETAYTVTGLTAYGDYDFELRAQIDGADAGTAADYHSLTAEDTDTHAGIARPAGLVATTSPHNAGEIVLTWTPQTTFGTGFSNAEYEIRSKLASASWPGTTPFGWATITGSDVNTAAHTLNELAGGQPHDIQLRFKPNTAIGESAHSTIRGTASSVDAPVDFAAATSLTHPAAIDLTWTHQIDTQHAEAQYEVRHKLTGDSWPSNSPFGWTALPDSAADSDSVAYNEDSYTVSGLTSGSSYHVQLRFKWSNAVGSSTSVQLTATASGVPAPTSFSASTGDLPGEIDLAWSAVEGATYDYRYKVTGQGDSTYSSWDTGNSGTTATLTGLNAGANYTIQLRADVSSNTGPVLTTTADAQIQTHPGSFTVSTGDGGGELDLSWTIPHTGTPTGFEFRYKRATQGDGAYGDWTDVPDSVGSTAGRADETSYTITGLWGGVRYTAQIRTESAIGASPVDEHTTMTGTAGASGAPANFGATSGTTGSAIDLSWDIIPPANLPGTDSVVRYEYRYKLATATSYAETGPGSWAQVPDSAGSTAGQADEDSYTITGLASYTLYDVELRAGIDGDNNAGTTVVNYYSAAATADDVRSSVASPASFTAVTGVSGTPGEIDVSWIAQTTFGATFTTAKYEYRYKETATANWPNTSPFGWQDVPSSDRNTFAFTISGIKGGTAFDVQVRFVPNSTIGAGAAASDDATSSAVTAPTFNAVTSTSASGAIDLSWTAQTATSGSEAKYQVRSKRTNANWPAASPFGWTDVDDTGSDGAHNESSVTISGLTALQPYHVELRFHYSDAIGPSVATQRTATASRVPTASITTAEGGTNPGEIRVVWAPVTGATSYDYRYKLLATTNYPADGATGGWNQVPDGPDMGNSVADETSITITGLTGNQEYHVQIRAVVSGTGTGDADTATATATLQPRPATFTLASGSAAGAIKLDWTPPPSGTVMQYEYRYKQSSSNTWGSWTRTTDNDNDGDYDDERTDTITSLFAGESYDFELRVVNTGNDASQARSATRVADALTWSSALTATRGTNGGDIVLSWTALSSGFPSGDAVARYEYRYKLDSASAYPTSGPGSWMPVPDGPGDADTDPWNETGYTITGLASYTLYDIQVRAGIDGDDNAQTRVVSYYSASITSATAGTRSGINAPQGLSATGGTAPGSIVLGWSAQQDFGSTATITYSYRYKVNGAMDPSPWNFIAISGTAHDRSSHTITGLTNNVQYDFQLKFNAGSGLDSGTAMATGTTTAVAAPQNFRAVTSTTAAGAIDIRWDPQTAVTASTAEFQYRVKPAGQADPTPTWAWREVPDDTSATDTDTDRHDESRYSVTELEENTRLMADTSYTIELRFFVSTAVGASTTVTQTQTASSVPVPQSLSASTGGGAGELDLTWTGITGATDYEFRYKPSPVPPASTTPWPAANAAGDWTSTGSTTASHTIGGLSGGVRYDVQVRAVVTGIGRSSESNTASDVAQTTPGPATFTLTAGTNPGEIVLSWDPPMDTSAPVTHYEYRYKLSSPTSAYPSSYTRSPDSDSDGNYDDERGATLTGLMAGMRYDVQIRIFASNAVGYSLPQTKSLESTPVPPPTNFMADTMATLNPGEVKLDWDAPAGVSILRYEIRHRLGTTGRWSSWTSTGTATTHTYTGLRAGQLRTFELKAFMQTVGSSAAVSTTGTPTPVPQPTLTATTGTFPGEINLSWTAVTGATSYQYRVRLSSVTGAWPDDAWVTVSSATTSTTITGLSQDSTMLVSINYRVELRAVIRNVGESDPDDDTASPRNKVFTDTPDSPNIAPTEYEVSDRVPGFLLIVIPSGNVDPFIYRYRTANPGDWSRWFKVTPRSGQSEHRIPGLMANVEYQVEIRAYRGMTAGFTTARTQTSTPLRLDPPAVFDARESSGVILLTWASPPQYIPDGYQYRTRETGTTQWSGWIDVDHEGGIGAPQERWVTGLMSGVIYDFQLRTNTAAGDTEPTETFTGSTRLNVAEVHEIRPTVRSVNVRAGDQIALTVDIYDAQEVLDNSIFGREDGDLVFKWEEKDGNGTFATPNNGRRVTYTVPQSPGVYTVVAEAQPDGICTSHHLGTEEISAEHRAPCQATFTIRVSAAPTVTAPRPDPVDPRSIPTSLTDDDGQSYAVFTPAAGGTYTGEQITVTAPAGAIPDRTFLGIASTVSEIMPPAPIPGTTLTVAGSYHDVTAITGDDEPPVPAITLASPITACLPFPQEFRADLSNVVVVQRKADGNLTLLSSKVRLTAGEFQVCGTLSTLPATLGVARVGTVPQPAPDREAGTTPGIETPDTGAWSPGWPALAIMLILGAILMTARLTGMHRIHRM